MSMNNVGLATVGAALYKHPRRARPVTTVAVPAAHASRNAPGFDTVKTLRAAGVARQPSEVLQLLACFQDGADMAAFTSLASRSADLTRDLDSALRSGMIVASASSPTTMHYRFVHDGLRQQIYQQIPARHRAMLHLRFGRQRLAETLSRPLPGKLSAILDHLHLGAAAMQMGLERTHCARLNLQAAQRACACADLIGALRYCDAGLAALDGSVCPLDHAVPSAPTGAGASPAAPEGVTPPGLEHAEFAFFSGLAHASADTHESDTADAQAHLDALNNHRQALAAVARHSPLDVAAMNSLLAAESARLQSHDAFAMQAYEQAIEAATAQGQLHVLAIAHELAGRFYGKLNLATASSAHLRLARRTYEQLGAKGTARHLSARHCARAMADAPRKSTGPTSGEPAPAVTPSPFAHFAATIAHEVNQPIAAMVLNANAALNWLKRETPDLAQVRTSLQTVVASGKRAGEIIQSMRRLAQHAAPEKAPVSIDDLIRDVLGLMRSKIQQSGIVVETLFGLEQRIIRADRCQLQQVLMNLVANAIDAMARVSDRPRLLNVTSRFDPGGATLCISVEDNGVGVTPAQAPHIFDALVSCKPDGMGMGLAICRAVVDAHGGHIWCEAPAAHGAAFHIRLPGLIIS